MSSPSSATRERSPCSLQLEKSQGSSGDPAQPKLNKYLKKKKKETGSKRWSNGPPVGWLAGGKVRFLTQVFFPRGTPGRVAPGWQGYLLEQWAGHLTSSSELWPQKLHPGPCQGPKDATPSSCLSPTPGHTTHSAHSIHASRVCKRGPSPCASPHTARASQVGLLSARGEAWCPGRIPLFWGVSRPTPLCLLSLPL